jgi:hypothetical protein
VPRGGERHGVEPEKQYQPGQQATMRRGGKQPEGLLQFVEVVQEGVAQRTLGWKAQRQTTNATTERTTSPSRDSLLGS